MKNGTGTNNYSEHLKRGMVSKIVAQTGASRPHIYDVINGKKHNPTVLSAFAELVAAAKKEEEALAEKLKAAGLVK